MEKEERSGLSGILKRLNILPDAPEDDPEDDLDEEALFPTDWEQLAKKIEDCFQDRAFLKQKAEKQAKRKKELSFDWAERIVELITA